MKKKNTKTCEIKVNFQALSEKSKQSWTIPDYYEDEIYQCVDCGVECSFSAKEQQQWYEVKKRYFWVRPIRCLGCNKKFIEEKKIKNEMDTSIELFREKPSNATAFECAFRIVEYFENKKQGNINFAIHLLRNLGQRKPVRELLSRAVEARAGVKENLE